MSHPISVPPVAPARSHSRRRLLLASLAGSGFLLNILILYLAYQLLLDTRPRTSAPLPPEIRVLYEDEPALQEPFRSWVIQEDGRQKPFDTFCREAVRAVCGRERLGQVRSPLTGHLLAKGHDPVAVVLSWLLLDARDNLDCDWESHPFILCSHPELRSLLDRAGPGQHVEPAVLRASEAFGELLGIAFRKRAEGVALLVLEREALEVADRLRLYDRIRNGGTSDEDSAPGGLRIVALDESGTWFSLASLRAYGGEEGAKRWSADLERRHLADPERPPEQPPLPVSSVRQVLSAYTDLQSAYYRGESVEFAAASERFLAVVESVHRSFAGAPGTDTITLELWYNEANPFRKAWVAGVVSALLLGGSLLVGRRWNRAGLVLYLLGLAGCAGALACAVVGFYCRVGIASRPPVGNMYETILWVAFLTAGLGLVLEGFYRARVIALAAALVSALGFLVADQLPLTFSPALQPLQAVLRSNYWLIVHVLTIVSSYAPFALAWGLGNLELGLLLFAPGRRDLIATLSHFCYRCIQVGVLLLFLGTMLGGFWAAESWVRFWGWDPKEVWALVALLCYLIPLHARYVGWLGDFGLAVCSVVCFASVVMAWYGVNFVLGAGLHSYGFGSGSHTGVYLAGLINLSLVVHGSLRYVYRKG
jgi:ABC-type transport system involved in cytochrome c biogenesis permease subunit